MFICLNRTELFLCVIVAAGLFLIPTIIIRYYYQEKRKTDLKMYEALNHAEGAFSAYERELMRNGYLFTALWTIVMIQNIARTMGMILDKAEAIKVAAIVKASFDPDRGINTFTIKRAIQTMAQQHVLKH
jgi:hypothetical protein